MSERGPQECLDWLLSVYDFPEDLFCVTSKRNHRGMVTTNGTIECKLQVHTYIPI